MTNLGSLQATRFLDEGITSAFYDISLLLIAHHSFYEVSEGTR